MACLRKVVLLKHKLYVACAHRILDCPTKAEDVVQDVLVRLAADPPRMGAGSESAHVHRMVRNLAIDRARRCRSERRLLAPLDLTWGSDVSSYTSIGRKRTGRKPPSAVIGLAELGVSRQDP